MYLNNRQKGKKKERKKERKEGKEGGRKRERPGGKRGTRRFNQTEIPWKARKERISKRSVGNKIGREVKRVKAQKFLGFISQRISAHFGNCSASEVVESEAKLQLFEEC